MYWNDPILYGASLPYRDLYGTSFPMKDFPVQNPVMGQLPPWAMQKFIPPTFGFNPYFAPFIQGATPFIPPYQQQLIPPFPVQQFVPPIPNPQFVPPFAYNLPFANVQRPLVY